MESMMEYTAIKTNRRRQLEKIPNSLLYGVVNSIRAIPTMYGYTVIIFSHPTFGPFMPALSKLVIFSSAVHQLMFTLMSSLPFAIGQVQDAGLIFLSAIASSICNSLGHDASSEAKVATAIVTIGIATASLGVCLIVMGQYKLAALASYLPVPVIGGYLAFIGIFCLYAGLALSTGLVIDDFSSMLNMLDNAHNVLLCLPGFLGGATLLVVSQNFKNPFALSTAIMVMPLGFFLVLAVSSISLEEARGSGWVDPVEESASTMELVNLFDFSLVHWSQIPKQVVSWLGMVFIVAFSSSLDVVAIEIDMGRKLNINHELKTVGWSNVVSGLLGGYTGSYIFGQTIFTCRSKTNSRVVGVCVIFAEIAVVAIPVSVMSYVPRFFLAATLIFVALDLMLEWLVFAYRKMCLREWAVVWLSFLAINLVSLDVGMLIGVGIAIINFLLSYVQVPVMISPAARDFAEISTRKHGAISHFEFSGYLFFGSAVQILEGPSTLTSSVTQLIRRASSRSVDRITLRGHGLQPRIGDGRHCSPRRLPNPEKNCKSRGIMILFANVQPDVRTLLMKNEAAEEQNFFETTDSALESCENHLMSDIFRTECHSANTEPVSLLRRLVAEFDNSHLLRGIDHFFQQRQVPVGYEFYSVAQSPNCFFLLSSGRVTISNHVNEEFPNGSVPRLETVLPGSMFGEVAFFSRQRRYTTASAIESCTVFEMTRVSFDAMKLQAPALSHSLRDIVVQSMALSLGNLTSNYKY